MCPHLFNSDLLTESLPIKFTKQATLTARAAHLPLLAGDFDWSPASCLHTKAADITPFFFFFFREHEWAVIREAHRWAAARLPPSARSAQVGLSTEATACPPAAKSLGVTAASGSVQSRRGAGSQSSEQQIRLPLLSELRFEGCWFFKLHWAWPFYLSSYAQGPFSSFLTCISKSREKMLCSSKNGTAAFSKNPKLTLFLSLHLEEDLDWWSEIQNIPLIVYFAVNKRPSLYRSFSRWANELIVSVITDSSLLHSVQLVYKENAFSDTSTQQDHQRCYLQCLSLHQHNRNSTTCVDGGWWLYWFYIGLEFSSLLSKRTQRNA